MTKIAKLVKVVVALGRFAFDTFIMLATYLQSRYFEKAISVNAVSWFSGYSLLKRDVKVMDSRIDYLISGRRGRRGYMELKSAVYLDRSDGYAMYPDTISERGRRHVKLLAKLAKRGGRMIITFLACHPRAVGFKPCMEGDPIMPALLREACESGVELRAVRLYIDPGLNVVLDNDDLPIKLD